MVMLVSCSRPSRDPLQLDRSALTVHNQTDEHWTDVAIWLNHHFRVTTPRIAAGSQFRVPLDSFVEAYGRRFEFSRMQITDLRLTARLSDGEVFELKKRFNKDSLSGALQGMGGTR